MTKFAKFDPRPFLEQHMAEGLAGTGKDTTRAAAYAKTLATLAASPPQNKNKDAEHLPSMTAYRHGENRKPEPAPAKVAKAANIDPSVVAPDDAPWGETEEERAAVIQYDGGATRTWAEALARLDRGRPPCDIPPIRWLRFIDDCGRFFDDGWAAFADRLGWGPLDLFGCDRTKPFARINRAGLLWLLNGRKLLALGADAAAIATACGGYLTIRRRFREPGGVVAWELPLNAA
jgi:hypothetical protein